MMKTLLSVIVLTFFFSLTPNAFAETSVTIEGNGEGASSEVRVESSTGESTVCVNGHCTTTQNGGSSATVCINGKCETSNDGNIEKNEGSARVQVENNTQGTTQSNPSSTSTPSPNQDSKKETTNSAEASKSAEKSDIKDPSTLRQPQGSGQEKGFSFEAWMNDVRIFFSELFR